MDAELKLLYSRVAFEDLLKQPRNVKTKSWQAPCFWRSLLLLVLRWLALAETWSFKSKAEFSIYLRRMITPLS